MSDADFYDDRAKKERSPSFPFISLRKAVDRAEAFWTKHRREPTRLVTAAPTWGYGAKSSGLAQTVATLKQFGLIEDSGSREDRRIQLTDLARRIISDQRPGAREGALKEAALRPRLFKEYERWAIEPVSEAHCISELELDRGFTPDAARAFLRTFRETMSFAGLAVDDTVDPYLEGAVEPPVDFGKHMEASVPFSRPAQRQAANTHPGTIYDIVPSTPDAMLKIEVGTNSIGVSARLTSAAEVKKLIQLLQAVGGMLPPGDAESDD